MTRVGLPSLWLVGYPLVFLSAMLASYSRSLLAIVVWLTIMVFLPAEHLARFGRPWTRSILLLVGQVVLWIAGSQVGHTMRFSRHVEEPGCSLEPAPSSRTPNIAR